MLYMGKVNLIHEELSFKLRGVFYDVHNELGRYRNEQQYGDAIELRLKTLGIPYQREAILDQSFVGEHKGRNRPDFIVDSKVIIEIKTVPSFSQKDYAQCLRYLTSSNYDLVLLVNFNLKFCAIKRMLSPKLLANNR